MPDPNLEKKKWRARFCLDDTSSKLTEAAVVVALASKLPRVVAQTIGEAFSIRETKKNRPDQEYSINYHESSVIDRELSTINYKHSMIDYDYSMLHYIRYNPIQVESSIRVGDIETIVGGIGTILIYSVSPRENKAPKVFYYNNERSASNKVKNIIKAEGY
ncbi:hypothetical protein N7530_007099, partial [Penicillium desertorum]